MEAFSKWLASLDYYWILLGAVVLMAILFFIFRANPKTRRVTGQLITLSGMCVMTLLYYILTFSLRVSKMSESTGFTARTMPRLWCALMVPIAIAPVETMAMAASRLMPLLLEIRSNKNAAAITSGMETSKV